MATALSVAFTATPLGATDKLLVEATPQISAGITFVGRSRFRAIQVMAAATVSPSNVLAAYNAKFGALVVGKKIFFRLTVIQSDGQRSAPLVTSVTVA